MLPFTGGIMATIGNINSFFFKFTEKFVVQAGT